MICLVQQGCGEIPSTVQSFLLHLGLERKGIGSQEAWYHLAQGLQLLEGLAAFDSRDREKGGKEEKDGRQPAEGTQGCPTQAALTRELISWMDRNSSSSRESRLEWRGCG